MASSLHRPSSVDLRQPDWHIYIYIYWHLQPPYPPRSGSLRKLADTNIGPQHAIIPILVTRKKVFLIFGNPNTYKPQHNPSFHFMLRFPFFHLSLHYRVHITLRKPHMSPMYPKPCTLNIHCPSCEFVSCLWL